MNIARPSSVEPVSTLSSTLSAAPAASASIESNAASVPTPYRARKAAVRISTTRKTRLRVDSRSA